jgi:exodeoxyribonuclease VII small subunit
MARKQPSNDDAAAGSGEAPSFEQAMGELETLVERMEQGEVSLEESLKAFERGRALVDRCKSILDDAERRIEQMGLDSLPGGERA